MAANSAYVAPFPKAPISGYDFGAKAPAGGWIGTGTNFGWPVHLGTDFGTPAGEAIVASAPATTKFQTGLPGYGNKLTETFDNGWSLVFGHVAAGASARVAPGQQIGVTGRDVGSAKGAVTLVELRNPQGQAQNPDPFIQSLVSGGISIPNPGDLSKLSSLIYIPNPGDVVGLTAASANIASAVTGIPTQIGHGLADFFVTSEQNIAEWLKRQSVAFFVAAIVLLVLFL